VVDCGGTVKKITIMKATLIRLLLIIVFGLLINFIWHPTDVEITVGALTLAWIFYPLITGLLK